MMVMVPARAKQAGVSKWRYEELSGSLSQHCWYFLCLAAVAGLLAIALLFSFHYHIPVLIEANIRKAAAGQHEIAVERLLESVVPETVRFFDSVLLTGVLGSLCLVVGSTLLSGGAYYVTGRLLLPRKPQTFRFLTREHENREHTKYFIFWMSVFFLFAILPIVVLIFFQSPVPHTARKFLKTYIVILCVILYSSTVAWEFLALSRSGAYRFLRELRLSRFDRLRILLFSAVGVLEVVLFAILGVVFIHQYTNHISERYSSYEAAALLSCAEFSREVSKEPASEQTPMIGSRIKGRLLPLSYSEIRAIGGGITVILRKTMIVLVMTALYFKLYLPLLSSEVNSPVLYSVAGIVFPLGISKFFASHSSWIGLDVKSELWVLMVTFVGAIIIQIVQGGMQRSGEAHGVSLAAEGERRSTPETPVFCGNLRTGLLHYEGCPYTRLTKPCNLSFFSESEVTDDDRIRRHCKFCMGAVRNSESV